MNKCKYVPCKDDPSVSRCTKCGRYDFGHIPMGEYYFTNRCPRCNAIVKIPKTRRTTKHGIVAIQGRSGDGIYLYRNKKLIGHSQCHKRFSSKELAEHIDVHIKFMKLTRERRKKEND